MLTNSQQRSCEIAACSSDIMKWEGICKQLQKYAPRKSSRDIVYHNRKWEVNSPYGSQYDMRLIKRERISPDLAVESYEQYPWSDSRESTGHSLHDNDPAGLLSAISNATIANTRDRASSSASLQLLQHHQQQQHQQHQNMLYTQHSWGPRQSS